MRMLPIPGRSTGSLGGPKADDDRTAAGGPWAHRAASLVGAFLLLAGSGPVSAGSLDSEPLVDGTGKAVAHLDSVTSIGVKGDSSGMAAGERGSRVVVDSSAAPRDGGSEVRPDSGVQTRPVLPFAPGEKIEYRVDVGFLGGRGRASLETVGEVELRERRAYHLRFKVKGGLPLAKVDSRLESWLDVERLIALQFLQDQKEVGHKKRQLLGFFPESREWIRLDGGKRGELATDEPLDDVSFLYFVRTLPLDTGETRRLDRYYKASGNPVILHVLRRERITVPSGTFDTVVVRPIIRTSGLFGEGGEAEVYFTDDERRIPVLVRSKVPVLGHLKLEMTGYTAGRSPSTGRGG